MLLQTNSYIVPKDKRAEHARLLRRFRQTLLRLGCDHFEVYEQVGANWNSGETTGRFVQILRFRDRKHQQTVQSAERTDTVAQALVQEFCELINFPYQQQQGLFAVGFYTSFLRMPTQRTATSQIEMSEGEIQGAVLPSPEPGVVEQPQGFEEVRAAHEQAPGKSLSQPMEEESFAGVDFNASDSAEPDAEPEEGLTHEQLAGASLATNDSSELGNELSIGPEAELSAPPTESPEEDGESHLSEAGMPHVDVADKNGQPIDLGDEFPTEPEHEHDPAER